MNRISLIALTCLALVGCNLTGNEASTRNGGRLSYSDSIHSSSIIHVERTEEGDTLGFFIYRSWTGYKVYDRPLTDSLEGFVNIGHNEDSIRFFGVAKGHSAAYEWYDAHVGSWDSAYAHHAADSLNAIYISRHSLPLGVCNVAISATTTISTGDLTVEVALKFKDPIPTSHGPIYLDVEASTPPGVATVSWADKPVSGSYTIDCPDPRE